MKFSCCFGKKIQKITRKIHYFLLIYKFILINILVNFTSIFLLRNNRIDDISENWNGGGTFHSFTSPKTQLVFEVQADY